MIEDGRRFIEARDLLLRLREDLHSAYRDFEWPRFEYFNWARDYFDQIALDNGSPALRVVDDRGCDQTVSYADMSRRSSQVANFMAAQGIGAGDSVLIALVNCVPLWETMLAVIKIGAVMIPATTLLGRDDLSERLRRGAVKGIVTHDHLTDRFDSLDGAPVRIAVGDAPQGWVAFSNSDGVSDRLADSAPTRADRTLLLYFTSGTTSKPKLVEHTHSSYPIGHLTTMYWIGLKPGDLHLNLSSPGWAKHAWSCFFAPWNAQCCVLAYQFDRFDARALLAQTVRCGVTTFCAPPTVWRMLIQQDLTLWPVSLREAVSAGEPLNPEVIDQVRAAWGVTIRDGFGQTETTAQVGNPPGQRLKEGSMGRALPGYRIALMDAAGHESNEGEICVDLAVRPVGVMNSYFDDPAHTKAAMRDGFYHTGDVAVRDDEGYLTFVGRTDDVFKSSDYRISPFELESVLIEHPAVAEAAVVPSPDPLRLSVPKAYVTLAAGNIANGETARSILLYVRQRVSPYKRIRRIEFSDLPKTISGKIRRVELRKVESARIDESRRENEYWEDVLDREI